MNIKKSILSWIDTGCNKELLKNTLVDEGYSEEAFNQAFDEMIADKTIVLGAKSQLVVVAEWMPNKAEKLRNE